MRVEPGWERSPRRRAPLLALVTVFGTGGCARSLNDTASSHHPTPAAACVLVENPPGEGVKEAISRSQSWEVETEGLAALQRTPRSLGLADALPAPPAEL